MVRPLALGDLTWYRISLLILKWRERGHTSCLNYWVRPQQGWWQELVRSGSRHRVQGEIWTLRIGLLMGSTHCRCHSFLLPSLSLLPLLPSLCLNVLLCLNTKLLLNVSPEKASHCPDAGVLVQSQQPPRLDLVVCLETECYLELLGQRNQVYPIHYNYCALPLTGNCHIEKSTVTESQLVRQSLKRRTMFPKMIRWSPNLGYLWRWPSWKRGSLQM